MNHHEWLEQAEIYALDALDGEELTQFEAHLASRCLLCEAHVKGTREALTLLPRSVEPLPPPQAIKAGLLARIAGGARLSEGDVEQAGLLFVRSTEGGWQEMAPGVMAKILFDDPVRERATALVRMGAGSRYGTHRHAEVEELYVLEGDCFCGGRWLGPGDYHRAEAGSMHGETYTEHGCLMLVMSSPRNEMLT